jgi:hypothetical protein
MAGNILPSEFELLKEGSAACSLGVSTTYKSPLYVCIKTTDRFGSDVGNPVSYSLTLHPCAYNNCDGRDTAPTPALSLR